MIRHSVQDVTLTDVDIGSAPQARAALIVNADDWGCSRVVTDRTLDCALSAVVSSASAMVFMEDSERAADLARQHDLDCGLHLNLTTSFSARNCPSRLREQQQKVSSFLRTNRLCQAIYHPGLAAAFDYVVRAQREEYQRLYHRPAARIDGHHHMHLCANVLLQRLLARGTIVRRNFSFRSGEKSGWNRMYRRMIDAALARRHRLTDYLFSLVPFEPVERLEYIFSLAEHSIVEVETHPAMLDEYTFLASGEIFRCYSDITIADAPAIISSQLGNSRAVLKPV